MTGKRHLLVVVALLVGGSLAVSTTGFSSVTADRSVEAGVAADDEAYLGIQRECSNSTLQVGIINRFSTGNTLDVSITVNGTTETIDDLSPGESQSEAFDTFDTGDTIRIDASGSGVAINLSRPIPTGC